MSQPLPSSISLVEPGSGMGADTVLGPGRSSDMGLEPVLAFESVLRPDLAFETFVTVLAPLVVFEAVF